MKTLSRPNRNQPATTPPMIHLATPDRRGALCGAPVIGVLTPGRPLDCVVCAELRAKQ